MLWIPQLEEQGEESQEVKKWTQGQCHMEDIYHKEDLSKEEEGDQTVQKET